MKEESNVDVQLKRADGWNNNWLADEIINLCDSIKNGLQETNKKLEEVAEVLSTSIKEVETQEEPITCKVKPRELLFRGWGCNGEGWVYGGHAECNYNQSVISLITDNIANTKQTSCITTSAVAVLPESVGRYTGRVDDKGIKIFEGDTIELDARGASGNKVRTGVIIFDEDPPLAGMYWGLCGESLEFYTANFIGTITLLKTPDYAQ